MKPTYKEEIEKKIEICVRHACESHMYAPTNRDFKNNKTTRGTAKKQRYGDFGHPQDKYLS